MKKKTCLDIRSLSFSYQEEKALKRLKLRMFEGERLGVVGASGSGKSTLLKLVAGKLEPSEGEIKFKGENLAESRNELVPGHPQIALMSQDFDLSPHLSAEENIARSGRHLSPTALKRYLGRVRRAFHLQSIKHKKVQSLSGGQKQRVALAAALISASDLLLLDEPFSQLDYQLKQDMLDFLREDQSSKSIIMVGHEPTDLMRFCDRIAVLDKGKLIAVDSIHKMFHYPKSLKAAQMTGMVNALSNEELATTGFTEALIRPSHVFLKKGGNWLLERIDYHAFGRLALMQLKDTEIKLWVQLASDAQYEPGSLWNLSIKKP